MKLIFSLATLLLMSGTNALNIPDVGQGIENVRRDPCADLTAATQPAMARLQCEAAQIVRRDACSDFQAVINQKLAQYFLLTGTLPNHNDPKFLAWANQFQDYVVAERKCQG
ncbi:hypothetical protein C8J57DRAFT_1339806, partial [Mycena rebaudengoi]